MTDPGPPVPRSLARMLDELAREDAAAMLEEARDAARDRVRARLTDELERRTLARIADTAGDPPAAPEPRSALSDSGELRAPEAHAGSIPAAESAGETGVYVYAIIAPAPGAVGLAAGIGGAPVRILESEAGGLRALVSDVPLDAFGDEALKRNLNDLTWVSATAVAHEGVVEAAMDDATLVPLRMCTIFRDEEAAREMLRREAPTLHAALERLRGTREWGVKVIADGEAFATAVARDRGGAGAATGDAAAPGEGAGYFAALRTDRALREDVAAQLDDRTREIHDAFGALAVDARLHPPSNRELAGYQGDMVLNGAYLVAAGRTEALRALAASLADRHAGDGLSVELTGPWPPYNFSMLAGGL